MSKNQIQPHDYRYCRAKNRKGKPCRLRAGWGTNHVGYGRCKLHGGKSPGAPKGNKNALKHGKYTAEAIAERRYIRSMLRLTKELISQSEALFDI